MTSVREIFTYLSAVLAKVALYALLVIGFARQSSAFAPPTLDPRVGQSLDRAVRYLESREKDMKGGQKSLAALALLKAGKSSTHPIIASVLSDIEERCASGKYKPHSEHEGVYECGVELMLLQAAENDDLYSQIELATGYLIDHQLPNGAWTYPGQTVGDTSMSQYGMLGFWAAELAGVAVPIDVWNRATAWHVKTLMPDGGFSYHPGTTDGLERGASTHNLTNAGLGSLFVGRMHLFPEMPMYNSPESAPKPKPKAFGVLEAVKRDDSQKTAADRRAELPNPLTLTQLDEAIRRAMGWANSRFVVETPAVSKMYYYYTLERVGAFANVKTMGGKDWFSVCLDHLKKKQEPDGSWKTFSSPENGTSLGILFLVKSTDKILKEMVGSGLLTGGRGLPSDLTNADVSGGAIKEKRKIEGPLDELLTELSALNPDSIADAQAAIVEKVQVGNREELLGEMDRIRDLIAHPDPELRRTAVWALGRSGDLKDANLLISALNDNNVDVLTEAYNSLSYLSRKIDGVGMDPSPFAGLSEFPTQPEKDAAMVAWRKEALKRWGEWYLRVRPYAERNDIFELGLKNKR
tara:strand:- start:80745 stop:82481 length:1737 start_codon:yes stop_codon:yes gene_type:complete